MELLNKTKITIDVPQELLTNESLCILNEARHPT